MDLYEDVPRHLRNAQTYVGTPLPKTFAARQEMGSPYIAPYRLALIVERRKDQSLLTRATGGFNPRTKLACFETEDTTPLSWEPVGPHLSHDGPRLCVSE
ncbi:hypothetical protein [Sphingomonas psychrotolerans]|uniref:Uncharacterized protein n=1 Tax=Sphingomonas psychrotolerans TaxID=1327635 RepID=A0A2K8MFR7_9SPHN|nr:hypothetical protein [Sphingomonas psychrotolerans]ATY31386.1 hypothetical protein CVN68_04825 [Sphingomonas psychrotolerans]